MVAPFLFLMSQVVRLLASIFVALIIAFPGPVAAGEIFDAVLAKDRLHCGVHGGQEGLAVKDQDGSWRGFEIDLCRAWSSALFGKADQVVFVEVTEDTALEALNERRADVIALQENALFGRRDVSFAGHAFVDSLSLMVRRSDAISNALELDKASVCYAGDEDAKGRVDAFANQNRITLATKRSDSLTEAFEELESGDCAALLANRLTLTDLRSAAGQGPESFEILPELLSKRLLGPVTLSEDREWLNLVRWGVFAMVLAEEKDVSSANLASMASSAKDPAILRLLGFEGEFGKQLGLDPLWAYRIIESVGNYGEVYARHFGPGLPTELERGPNSLWLDGGLMRAPPFQ